MCVYVCVCVCVCEIYQQKTLPQSLLPLGRGVLFPAYLYFEVIHLIILRALKYYTVVEKLICFICRLASFYIWSLINTPVVTFYVFVIVVTILIYFSLNCKFFKNSDDIFKLCNDSL